MILWTVQPRSALTDLETAGVFRCEREKSFNLTKPDSLEKPYQWLMGEMRRRIGEPPKGVSYPVWAWHTWEFQRQPPDPDSAAFVKRTEDKALLTLDLPEGQALLSDFDAWQLVLQNGYVADAVTEEEFLRLEERLDSLPPDALERETEASWQHVFLTGPLQTELVTRGKYIQATFWEIRKEYVRDAKILPALEE